MIDYGRSGFDDYRRHYALMAEATGEITRNARKVLDGVRRKKISGVIHPLITYEFLIRYHRKRLPAFVSSKEAFEFLNTYFRTEYRK